MTTTDARPVLDGKKLKWTLERMQAGAPGMVRIDWLRFTLPSDAISKRSPSVVDLSSVRAMDKRARDLIRKASTSDVEDTPSSAHVLARLAAYQLVSRIGLFEVGTAEDKGMDFYTARCPLIFEGQVVGFVLTGGKSSSQASTVHVNLFGEACRHMAPHHHAVIRDWLRSEYGWITRADLALDVWTGGDVCDVRRSYLDGEFDMRGKRPGQTENGSWTLGHSRTFNVGNRATGKLFRAYEKGDQLFGHEANDPWLRYEVELRNNHRIIDLDVLSKPEDFFAGAYPFCARVLAEQSVVYQSRTIPTVSMVCEKTAEAAAARATRWTARTAAPTICALLELGGDILLEIVDRERHRMPARLRGFTLPSLRTAFEKVASGLSLSYAPT